MNPPFKRHFLHRGLLIAIFIAAVQSGTTHADPTLELYVDTVTNQVYTKPGKNRVKLGTFEKVDTAKQEAKQRARKARRPAGVEKVDEEQIHKRLDALDEKVQDIWVAEKAVEEHLTPLEERAKRVEKLYEDVTSPEIFAAALKEKWYERISIRGYTQFRYEWLASAEGAPLNVPNDQCINNSDFCIRRARLIFSGDAAEHLFLYIQPELFAQPTRGTFAVQLRDAYGDISIDKEREYRFRLGQSKVPFGFVNLQSSQNRLAFERPDAINSAAETERDIGAFFYWAPSDSRTIFKDLVRTGLKGSGDYGVFGFGLYNGQGPNRLDLGDNPHYILRLSYPFKFENGQIFEPGIQGYTGDFVVSTGPIEVGGETITPTAPEDGLTDKRVGFSAILYPQPIGFEAEWNFGQSPKLSSDFTTVGVGSIHGGYFLLNAKLNSPYGTWYPFVRWQYFDGARKFATNAPWDKVNEWDFGVEWLPVPEVEVALQYAYAPYRTNTSVAPYERTIDANWVGLQVQWNY